MCPASRRRALVLWKLQVFDSSPREVSYDFNFSL